METIINDVEKANEILAEYKGSKVVVWSFNRFHEKIELLIDFVDNEYVVFLTLISCRYYKGDLYWLDSELRISTQNESDDEWMITKISDLKTGFYIECLGGFVLKKGLDNEFSFDDSELPDISDFLPDGTSMSE
ncbi:conserved hypothetical protein [Tenacibaculum maritimum]|uniref:hypothetical protein n=2 Tax=Tenacibaculum maritimum TaxID=107401 RepID=UPI0012E42B59|nr:hypothetical protein [Tenacibaculum maritimum]CAA0183459.1 conserved hypothetical protein [Tenacibaculum maritimum]